MIHLLRFGFLSGLIYCLVKGAGVADTSGGGVEGLSYMAMALILGVATAVVWAPYFGERIAAPLTSALTNTEVTEMENETLKGIQSLSIHGWRRLAAWLCLVQCIRHPKLSAPAWMGLENSPEGSWLQKEFAWRVYGFTHPHRCVEAWKVLLRHGIKPPPHHEPTIVMFLKAHEPKPEKEQVPVELEAAPPSEALPRDARIQLFELDEEFKEVIGQRRAAAEQAAKLERPKTPPPPVKAKSGPDASSARDALEAGA